MSFAAGIGAGIGAGIAIGIASGQKNGQKKAQEQIRDYLISNELTIHDNMGKELPHEALLNEVVAARECANRGWVFAALIALLAGIALFGAIAYFVLL